jgi:tRNA(Ile)-lysidine synthase
MSDVYQKMVGFEDVKDILRGKGSYLVALSGGVDSQVLLHLITRLKPQKVIAAHVNYGLRGKDSDRDESVASDWAKELGLPFYSYKVIPEDLGGNIQEQARDIRYRWFEELAKELDLQYILTAHHIDDQMETMSMRFFAGTRGKGLLGIAPISGNRVRPLLCLTKTEIISYAKEQNIPFRTDASNLKSKYLRNFFRNEVLPPLKDEIPHLSQRMLTTAYNIRQEQNLLSFFVPQLIAQHSTFDGRTLVFHTSILKSTVPVPSLLQYAFQLNANQVQQLTASDHSKVITLNDFKMAKFGGDIHMRKSDMDVEFHDHQHISEGEFDLSAGKLILQLSMRAEYTDDPNIEYIPAQLLSSEFNMRQWRAGDRISIHSGQSKKVSDVLNEAKLSPLEKEDVWCLTADGEILWVIGVRLSAQAFLSDPNESCIRIQYQPLEPFNPSPEHIKDFLS